MVWISLPLAYLMGSIPFGLLIGWLAGKDVRREGSRNIGFSNVLRVCGWPWAMPVLALDFLKGFAPVFWLVPLWSAAERPGLVAVLAGIAAILGHNYTVWLKFKGGKGVATSAGVLGGLMPLQLAVAFGTWLALVALTRYVSVGSMAATVALVVGQVALGDDPFGAGLPLTVLACCIAVLVFVSHRANIRRLLRGEENRIFSRKTPAANETGEEKRTDG